MSFSQAKFFAKLSGDYKVTCEILVTKAHLFSRQNIGKAIEISNEAKSIAYRFKNDTLTAKANFQIGKYSIFSGSNILPFDYLMTAMNQFSKLGMYKDAGVAANLLASLVETMDGEKAELFYSNSISSTFDLISSPLLLIIRSCPCAAEQNNIIKVSNLNFATDSISNLLKDFKSS